MQCRSSPCRSKIGCGRPRSPGTGRRAGRRRGRPRPRRRAGCGCRSPRPPGSGPSRCAGCGPGRRQSTRCTGADHGAEALHCGHGRDVMTWPRKERCTCCTSPRPWQSRRSREGAGGGTGALAGGAPDRGVDWTGRASCRTPSRARSSSIRMRASGRGARGTGAPGRRAAEEGVHDVAEAEARRRPRNPCRRCRTGHRRGRRPPSSGRRAPRRPAVTSLNRSCVSSSGLTSGCSSRASLR